MSRISETPSRIKGGAKEFLSGKWIANRRKEKLLRSEVKSVAKSQYKSLHQSLATLYQEAGLNLYDGRYDKQRIKISFPTPKYPLGDKDNWDVITYNGINSTIDVTKSRLQSGEKTLSQIHLEMSGNFSVYITQSPPREGPIIPDYTLDNTHAQTNMSPIVELLQILTTDTIGKIKMLDPNHLLTRVTQGGNTPSTTPYGLSARGAPPV